MSPLRKWMVAAVLAMLAALPGRSAAQVRLLLRFEHNTYLQFESTEAYVSIYNDTDRALCIGDGSSNLFSELSFLVEQRRDDWLPKRSVGPLVDGLILEPGEQRDVVVDLTRGYDLTAMGRYLVRAILRDKGRVVAVSPQVSLDVVRGLELESVQRAVPGAFDQIRTYSVRYWRRNRFEYAFLSVDEEATASNYGVFQLGKIVRTEKPVVTVERDGKVTVRHLCAPDCYIRTVFMSEEEGVRFVDQQYEAPDGTPYPNGPVRRHLPIPVPTPIPVR